MECPRFESRYPSRQCTTVGISNEYPGVSRVLVVVLEGKLDILGEVSHVPHTVGKNEILQSLSGELFDRTGPSQVPIYTYSWSASNTGVASWSNV